MFQAKTLSIETIDKLLAMNGLLKPIKKLDTLFKIPRQTISINASIETVLENWPFLHQAPNKCVILLIFNQLKPVNCFLWFKAEDDQDFKAAIKNIPYTQKKWFYTLDLPTLKKVLVDLTIEPLEVTETELLSINKPC